MRVENHRYPEMLLTLEAIVPSALALAKSTGKSSEVMEAFTNAIQGLTTRIPSGSFNKIIDGISKQDFNDHFEFDCGEDSEDVWQDFEMFHIEPDGDGYLVRLYLKVDYEVLRGDVVNDVSFSIDEMEVYDNEGDEMVLDYMQADQIKKAVESQNYKA